VNYKEATKIVHDQVAASRTSFRTGMMLLPKARREGMYALYAFCRAVDDIADESPSKEISLRELQEWRKRISSAFRGTASDAITTALLPAIKSFNLVEKDFQEIIDGMEMDSIAIVAPDMATLDLYCDRVASAVGRASVRIFGHTGSDAMNVAYHLGRAFQLTNILRDISEDAERGRLYIPRELLERHGITTRKPKEVILNVNLQAACAELAEKTKNHYAQADAYMNKCPALAMRPAKIMRTYYMAIFERLLELGWKDVSIRVSLPLWKKLALMLKGFLT